MKKIFTHMLFMLLALPTVMTLTSCDRDSMDRAISVAIPTEPLSILSAPIHTEDAVMR